MPWLKSASKLVFVIVAIAMCTAFLAVVWKNLDDKDIAIAVISIASASIGSAFTYYFTKKDNNNIA